MRSERVGASPPKKPLSRWHAHRAWPWLLGLLAFALREYWAQRQGWYTDEGGFTELALTLWRSGSASIGAIKQTAFLPMGCSLLAPALAAPWAGLAGEAIQGTRAWTALLSALAVVLLFQLGRERSRPGLAWGAGLALAASPLAAHLGAWAVYHHLGALGVVGCAVLAARFQEAPSRRTWLELCLAVGLTVTAAYWTLWLLALPVGLAWGRSRRAWLPQGLVLLVLPLALFTGLGYAVDPASFRADLSTLASLTQSDLPADLRRIAMLYSLAKTCLAFPPIALGCLGLGLLGLKDWRQRALSPVGAAALALVLGGLDVFRQRQNLEGFAYPLVLALPAACWGLGALVEAALEAWRLGQARWILIAAALVFAYSRLPDLTVMNQLCADPAAARELLAKAAQDLKAGDLVLGQVALDWGFPRGVKAAELGDVAAARGEATAFMRGGLAPSRMKFMPTLEGARWLVISDYTYGFSFTQAPCLRLGLMAEEEGFTKIWSNARYSVYANPALGAAKPAYAERILAYYNLYDEAAQDALSRHDWVNARFALLQGLPYAQGDRAGRQKALEAVEKQLRQP
jgi:hypothetical protein